LILKPIHDCYRKNLSCGLPWLPLPVMWGQGSDETHDRLKPVSIVKALTGLALGFPPGGMGEPGVVEGAEAGRPPGVIGFRIGMVVHDDVPEPTVDP
jgi:hypothetical protein